MIFERLLQLQLLQLLQLIINGLAGIGLPTNPNHNPTDKE